MMAKMRTLIPAPRGVRPSSMGFKNACFVETSDDLAAKYAWLKSSDRDSAMGTLSMTNRRVLVLAPGTHTVTSTLDLDTCFVDLCALIPENPEATEVTGAMEGSSLVKQTELNINLSGFTIHGTPAVGVSHAFEIAAIRSGTAVSDDSNPDYTLLTLAGISKGLSLGTYFDTSDNDRIEITGGTDIVTGWYQIYYVVDADSLYVLGDLGNSTADVTFNLCTENNHYRHMIFDHDNPGKNNSPCTFTHHANGLFEHCKGTNASFIFQTDVGIDYYFWCEMRFCTGGQYSFVGDRATMDRGIFKHCVGGDYCFASCNLDLNDGNTVVYNSTLIANGTGKSITAGEAQNVLALHCRMNLDKHANVTNLIGGGALSDGHCIVDSDVS